jgi:hypothetical protein
MRTSGVAVGAHPESAVVARMGFLELFVIGSFGYANIYVLFRHLSTSL